MNWASGNPVITQNWRKSGNVTVLQSVDSKIHLSLVYDHLYSNRWNQNIQDYCRDVCLKEYQYGMVCVQEQITVIKES